MNDFKSIISQLDVSLLGNTLMVSVACLFLDTPYVAGSLEQEPEQLRVNLNEMNCTVFVETVLAIVQTVKSNMNSYEAFSAQLQAIRYRNNVINDYTDRNHYFSDWIYENAKNGFVKDITEIAGGIEYSLPLNFMTEHISAYKQLQENPQFVATIRQKEIEISDRIHWRIDKADIAEAIPFIMDGDIICFTTNIAGLDISHVGIAFMQNGQRTFIHASSLEKKVVIESSSLEEYVQNRNNCTGIVIVRPVF